MSFLASLGVRFSLDDTSLIRKSVELGISALFVRDDDIPGFVSRGIADFGIVGQNVLMEGRADVETVMPLGFGVCSLTIAAPNTSSIKEPRDLEKKRVATTYPVLLRDYLDANRIRATIIRVAGSAEIAPELGLADAICDIVQTGTTLKAHNLTPIATVMESQAVLIASPVQKESKAEFLELIQKAV